MRKRAVKKTMPEEDIAAAPSEDNGNVPLDVPETPSEPVAEPEAPVEEPATPAEPEVELFETPDGRKVDAATLSREWKENFMPDYTKKSQALAAKETLTVPIDPLADPNYVPPTYAELAKQIEERTLKAIETKEQARIDAQQRVETVVIDQLNDIKKVDPQLNENALFLHASKYGFRDLKLAHQNMKDMSDVVKKVQDTTAKNIAKRIDPVSVSPGATGVRPEPSQFATSREYLNAVKASGKQ